MSNQTIRPQFIPRTKTRTCGVYNGFCIDPRTNWDQVGEDLYKAGFNSFSVFLALNRSPWPQKNGKFDFTKLDPEYMTELFRMFERLVFWRIAPHICFVDQFHSHHGPKGEPGDNPGPDHFRQGLGQGDGWDEEPLYSSITFGPTKNYWISWRDRKKGDAAGTPMFYDFQPLGTFGKGMLLYFDGVIDTWRKVVEMKRPNAQLLYPDARLSWKWDNETAAESVSPGGHTVPIRGDRDEIFMFLKDRWQKAGFRNGNGPHQVDAYIDYHCRQDGKKKVDSDFTDYQIMAEAYSSFKNRNGAKMEIHGILTPTDVKRYEDEAKKRNLPWDSSRVKYSTDGDLGMKGDYRGLGAGSIPDVDLKWDCTLSEFKKKWVNDNFQANWNWLFPRYRAVIKL